MTQSALTSSVGCCVYNSPFALPSASSTENNGQCGNLVDSRPPELTFWDEFSGVSIYQFYNTHGVGGSTLTIQAPTAGSIPSADAYFDESEFNSPLDDTTHYPALERSFLLHESPPFSLPPLQECSRQPDTESLPHRVSSHSRQRASTEQPKDKSADEGQHAPHTLKAGTSALNTIGTRRSDEITSSQSLSTPRSRSPAALITHPWIDQTLFGNPKQNLTKPIRSYAIEKPPSMLFGQTLAGELAQTKKRRVGHLEEFPGEDEDAKRGDTKKAKLFPSEEWAGGLRRSGRSAKLPKPNYSSYSSDDAHDACNRHYSPKPEKARRSGKMKKKSALKHRRVKCTTPGCNVTFGRATDMRRHVRTAACEFLRDEDGAHQAGGFYCHTCNSYTSRFDAFERHQRTKDCMENRGLVYSEPQKQKR